MVSALGYERSEPGFESRQPESDFSSTHQNSGGKISNTPAAPSTAPGNNYSGEEAQQLHYHGQTYTTSYMINKFPR